MNKITPTRVVKVLEGLSQLHEPKDSDDKFNSMVYRFCHLSKGTCKNSHEDWKKEFLEVEIEILNTFNVSPAEHIRRQNSEKRNGLFSFICRLFSK